MASESSPRGNPVYERVLTACAALRFDGPWSFVAPPQDCRAGIADPEATLQALRQEFGDETLLSAGVVQRLADGQAQLNPGLVGNRGVVALRTAPNETPFGLITSCGCLSSKIEPLFHVLVDRWTREALRHCQKFLICFSMCEVIIARALGMPATLAMGLDRFDSRGLRRLERLLGERPDGDECSVVILAWSLFDLTHQVPEGVIRLARHLAKAQDVLRLEFGNWGVWFPSRAQLEDFKFAVGVGDRRSVDTLLSEEDYFDIDAFSDPGNLPNPDAPSVDDNYVAACAELVSQFRENRNSACTGPELRSALRRYESLSQRDLVEPLRRQALETKDSMLRSAYDELATLCSLLHRTRPRLEQLLATHPGAVRWEDDALPPNCLDQYLLVSKRYQSLLREVLRLRLSLDDITW